MQRSPRQRELDPSYLTWHEALDRAREQAARSYLEAVMERFDGRVVEAARYAGVERESFYRLLRRYGVHFTR